jgi:hypothetical protein
VALKERCLELEGLVGRESGSAESLHQSQGALAAQAALVTRLRQEVRALRGGGGGGVRWKSARKGEKG